MKLPNYSLLRYEVDDLQKLDHIIFEFYIHFFRGYTNMIDVANLFNWFSLVDQKSLFDIHLIYIHRFSVYSSAVFTLPDKSLWIMKKFTNPEVTQPEFVTGWPTTL